MADVLYDLCREDPAVAQTYSANGQSALLAKDALVNRFGRGARPSPGDRSVETRIEADEFELRERFDSSTITREVGFSYRGVLDVPEILQSSEAVADEMSTVAHLVFLSIAESEEFLRPLLRRVKDLAALANMEEDQQGLRPGSLRGFFKFLYVHRSRVHSRPQLILTTEGSLRAIWRRSRDHRVAIRFMDDVTVSFVTFLPDEDRPTRINRVGGECSIEGFFRCVGLEALG